MNKRKTAIYLLVLLLLLNIIIIKFGSEIYSSNMILEFKLLSEKNVDFELFYSESTEMTPEQSELVLYDVVNKENDMEFAIPVNSNYLRLDIGNEPGQVVLSDFKFIYNKKILNVDVDDIISNQIVSNMIENIRVKDSNLIILSNGTDPYILIDIGNLQIRDWITSNNKSDLFKEKIFIIIVLDLIFIGIFIFANKLLILPKELYRNRLLILKLAKNDFKTKYAGSYFGVFWAFVQPIVTIVLYWFVFQVGLRTSNVNNYPFVLWLIAGLVPWFYFSDALNYGTNSLLEYNYLVKKVVFNISILPVVKIVSALFVHIFFILFSLLVFALLGYGPTIYSWQIIYYTFCIIVLSLSISYFTSSIIIFFRDLGQVINIVLQIGMWMTPIMWPAEMLPKSFGWILQVNPMYYIIRGYRDSLLDRVWFTEHLKDTFIFWLNIGLIFLMGVYVFKRLRSHFADVI